MVILCQLLNSSSLRVRYKHKLWFCIHKRKLAILLLVPLKLFLLNSLILFTCMRMCKALIHFICAWVCAYVQCTFDRIFISKQCYINVVLPWYLRSRLIYTAQLQGKNLLGETNTDIFIAHQQCLKDNKLQTMFPQIYIYMYMYTYF